MRPVLILVMVVSGCKHKSGEHQSNVGLCDSGSGSNAVDPAFIEQTQALLRDQLGRDGFKTCTRQAKRPFQLGARPVESYCGKIGGADVLALINRPGERNCTLELDLRADVEGTEAEISKVEIPIINYRNQVRTWFTKRLEQIRRPGQNTAVRASGAWLGDDSLLPLH